MSILQPGDVKAIADMARLGLDEDDVQRFGAEVVKVLEYAQKMSEVNTDGVVPTTHPVSYGKNVMRKDEARPSMDKEDVLMNAPQEEKGYFKVPRILEE